MSNISPEDRVRVMSYSDSVAAAALLAVPNKHNRTLIDSVEFKVALQFQLGDLPYGGNCFDCGLPLDPRGIHATGSCAIKAGTTRRHHSLSQCVGRFASEGGLRCDRESPALFGRGDRRRPADVAIADLDGIGLTAIDLSISQGACPSNIATSLSGTLLVNKEKLKRDKYQAACTERSINLRPFAMESSGRLGASAFETVKQIVSKSWERARQLGDEAVAVQVRHFLQCLSCTMRSENARMILNCAGQNARNSAFRNDDPFNVILPS